MTRPRIAPALESVAEGLVAPHADVVIAVVLARWEGLVRHGSWCRCLPNRVHPVVGRRRALRQSTIDGTATPASPLPSPAAGGLAFEAR